MINTILQTHNIEEIKQRFLDSKNPYKYVYIDNFFTEEFVSALYDSYPDLDTLQKDRDEISGKKNILEQGMYGCSVLNDMSPVWQSSLVSLNSPDFVHFVKNITSISSLTPDNYNSIGHWAGIRAMTEGSYQLIHSDARIHPYFNVEKKITFLFYLNKHWQDKDSGYLEIWDDNMSKCVDKIAPLYNRAVFFENTATSYHGVPEVNSFRKSFLLSYLSDSEKPKETRRKALFVQRPNEPQGDLVSEVARARLDLTDY